MSARGAENCRMPRLRQPISGAQAFVLVFSGVAFGLARHWAGPLTPPQFVLAVVLLEFAVQPFSYLIHELGHALAACRLTKASPSVIVGRGPWLKFSLGRVRVHFSLLPSRGVMIGGICRYDAVGVPWRTRAVISMSGPAATMLEFLAGLGVAALVWHQSGSFVRNLIVLALIGLFTSVVFNLVPVTVKQQGVRRTLFANDGTNARAALKHHRRGTPHPTRPPAAAGSAARHS